MFKLIVLRWTIVSLQKGKIVVPVVGSSNGPTDMRQVHPKDLEKLYDQLNSIELAGQEMPQTMTVKLNHRWNFDHLICHHTHSIYT